MKVLDLQCAHQHVFEGWFGSDEEFASQCERGLLTCPVCGDADVRRKLSAPKLQRKSNSVIPPSSEPTTPVAEAVSAPAGEELQELIRAHQETYMKVVRHVLQNTEDVGAQFAEEARRMHYGEAETRAIRGQATAEEKTALSDEGIEVMSLPLPKDMNGPLQ